MTEEVKFDDWKKLNLVVGTIIDAQDHPNADKLYVIDVDLGSEKIKVVAGLKNHYSPKELKGKQCIVFRNLEPKEIRGIKGDGMILAASNEDKSKVFILSPEKKIDNGSRIG